MRGIWRSFEGMHHWQGSEVRRAVRDQRFEGNRLQSKRADWWPVRRLAAGGLLPRRFWRVQGGVDVTVDLDNGRAAVRDGKAACAAGADFDLLVGRISAASDALRREAVASTVPFPLSSGKARRRLVFCSNPLPQEKNRPSRRCSLPPASLPWSSFRVGWKPTGRKKVGRLTFSGKSRRLDFSRTVKSPMVPSVLKNAEK